MSPKVIIATLSVAMTLFGYWFYFRDIFLGHTKPHAYSWLVWALLTALGAAAQIAGHAGPGAWVTVVTAAISFVIFSLATVRGEKNITLSDKLNLLAASVALLFWFATNSPIWSVILITMIDFLGLVPTIRKSINKPHEETLITYFLSGTKFALGIVALESYSLVTWLYPASLVIANYGFVTMLLVRRKQLGLKPGMSSHEVF